MYNISIKKLFKIALIECYKENIEIFYTNSLKHYYYLILAGIIIDYEEQCFIIRIKQICSVLFVTFFQKNKKT